MTNDCFVTPNLAGGVDKIRSFIKDEITNNAKTFTALTNSTDPFPIKFHNFLKEVHGFDFSQPMQLNQRVLNWSTK